MNELQIPIGASTRNRGDDRTHSDRAREDRKG